MSNELSRTDMNDATSNASCNQARPKTWRGMEALEARQLLSVSLNEAGWTEVTASSDTRIIYVSSSEGSDSNDGLSENSAVATLEKAKSLVRDGMPDWVLLKRGDVWYEDFGKWQKSGRSADEPMLLSAYGTGDRPELRTGRESAITSGYGDTVSNVSIIGLHFYSHTRDTDSQWYEGPSSGNRGIGWLADGENLLIEDVRVTDYRMNIVVQANTNYDNLQIRRSVVLDAYNPNGYSSGAFIKNVDGVLLEENIFDHNGWDLNANADRTQFNHNVYVQVDNTDLVARGNIFSRGASHGLQARPGGEVVNNLFVGNALGFSFGNVLGGKDPADQGITGLVADNVVLHGDDIGDLARGFGFEIGNVLQATVTSNLVAHDNSHSDYGAAVAMQTTNGIGLTNLDMTDNVIYNWRGGLKFESGGNVDNVNLTNNTIHALDNSTFLVKNLDSSQGSEIDFTGTQFYSNASDSRWYKVDGRARDHAYFVDAMGDNSNAGEADFMDPSRDINGYAGSMNNFYSAIREQSAANYNLAYTADVVNDWMREGFGIEQYTNDLYQPGDGGGVTPPPAPQPEPPAEDPAPPVLSPEIDVTDSTGAADNHELGWGLFETEVGQTSDVGTFMLANTGDGDLDISSFTVGGLHAGDFNVEVVDAAGNVMTGDSLTIASGDTATIRVTFQPNEVGERSAAITFNTNDADEGAFTLEMSGTGLESTVDETPIEEPTPPVEEPVDEITPPVEEPVDETPVEEEQPPVVDPPVVEDPIAFGPELSISDSTGDPSNLELGFGLFETAVGQTSAAGVFTLANTGDQDVEIENLRIRGHARRDFKVIVRDSTGDRDRDDDFTIKPGETYTIEVTFSPRAAGVREGYLQFTTNDPDYSGRVELTLSATGMPRGWEPIEDDGSTLATHNTAQNVLR